jgi:hypothetical protein
MKNYSLTCNTDKCINKDIAIQLATEAEQFVCGPCGQPIASVVEIAFTEPEEASAE